MNEVRPPEPTWQMKVYSFFTVLGWVLIIVLLIIGVFVLVPTAADYWGGNAKAVRDAADAGSSLIGQLGTLAVTIRWLEPLTFFGCCGFHGWDRA